MEALHEIAQILTEDPRFRDSPLIVKGGTSLALGYGLPRPSTDLDITCQGRPNKEQVLAVAVTGLSRTGDRSFTRTDIKQRGRGFLRLQWDDRADNATRRVETRLT